MAGRFNVSATSAAELHPTILLAAATAWQAFINRKDARPVPRRPMRIRDDGFQSMNFPTGQLSGSRCGSKSHGPDFLKISEESFLIGRSRHVHYVFSVVLNSPANTRYSVQFGLFCTCAQTRFKSHRHDHFSLGRWNLCVTA
jgi:hypothetical protein